MRIIRGKYKTRRFKVPKNFPSRPTTDFAKEGLFNIIEHQYLKEDMEILDLCAGSGNISFEFLSREHGHVTAVDNNYNCFQHIKAKANELDAGDSLNVVKSDILKFLEKCTATYDLIFADPPYIYEHHDKIADIVFSRHLLNDGGILIIEHGKETSLESITQFDFVRTYGNVHFSFLSEK